MSEKNDTSTNERDIEGLLGHLVDGQQEYALLTSKSAHAYHAALIALLAERNSLKQRVAELEAQKPADRDLRERNDTMVRWMNQVTAMLCHSMTHSIAAKQELMTRCDTAISAMRRTGDPVRDLCGGSDCDLDGEKLVATRKGGTNAE